MIIRCFDWDKFIFLNDSENVFFAPSDLITFCLLFAYISLERTAEMKCFILIPIIINPRRKNYLTPYPAGFLLPFLLRLGRLQQLAG
jgi:hypothetical protein